jgi:CRP/FNR family transcriptional regulator
VNDRSALLERIPFLSALPRQALDSLGNAFLQREFAPNSVIMREGEEPLWLGVVYSGRVKVVKKSPNGSDTTVAVLAPGEIFGEVSLFSGHPYGATVMPMTHCSVLLIERANVLDLVRRHSELAIKIIGALAERLSNLQNTMQSIATDRVDRRLTQLLLRLQDQVGVRNNGHVLLNMPLTRRELAEMAGTTVETTIRVISQLTKDGYLDTVPGRDNPKGCRQCAVQLRCPRCRKIVLLRPEEMAEIN